MNPYCATCKYFVVTSDRDVELKSGTCQRYAPMANGLKHGYLGRSVWPTVGEKDWCGEHSTPMGRGRLAMNDPISRPRSES